MDAETFARELAKYPERVRDASTYRRVKGRFTKAASDPRPTKTDESLRRTNDFFADLACFLSEWSESPVEAVAATIETLKTYRAQNAHKLRAMASDVGRF